MEHQGTVYADGRFFVKVATHSDPGNRGPRASSSDSLPPPTGDGPWSRRHAPCPEPTPLPGFPGLWACSQVDTQLPLCTPGLSVKGTAGNSTYAGRLGCPHGRHPLLRDLAGGRGRGSKLWVRRPHPGSEVPGNPEAQRQTILPGCYKGTFVQQ